MTKTHTYPVLDDCTRTASVIGTAGSPAEASAAWKSYHDERGGADAVPPQFAWRAARDLRLDDADDQAAIDERGGAYEPL